MDALTNADDASKEPSASLQSQKPVSAHRLSLPYSVRIITTTTGAFITGLFLGLSHGAQTAGYRFRAENSYRLPKSSIDWYFYHKSKNYHMMLGGVKEGIKMGPKIAFWSGGYFLIEEAVDRVRGTSDFLSSVIAGLSIAGGFSIWNRFGLMTAARTARVGLYSSLAFGLGQDALRLARGHRLGYVDSLLGRSRRLYEVDEKVI